MRSWFKWLLIVAVLLVSSGGNAHAFSDHAVSKATPCASHPHHEPAHSATAHEDCCCSCLSSPAGLVTPAEPDAPNPVAYSLHFTPAPASTLATRFLPPELDPPRPSA